MRFVICILLAFFSYSVFSSEELLRVAASEKVTAEDIKDVLAAGAVVNLRDSNRNTALHLLAQNSGNAEAISLLIQAQANPNLTNEFGETPLIPAINAKHLLAVRALLKGGTDPTITTNGKIPPLVVAILSREVEIITELIVVGRVDPNLVFKGSTPLMVAVDDKMLRLEIIEALITHGADPNLTLKSGATVWSPLFNPKKKLHTNVLLKVMEVLIAGGAEVDLAFSNAIVSNTSPPVITALLARGADPNLLVGRYYFPLHFAIRNGLNLGAVRALLRGGADPSLLIAGKNALHIALAQNPINSKLVRLLITEGKVDPDVPINMEKMLGSAGGKKLAEVAEELVERIVEHFENITVDKSDAETEDIALRPISQAVLERSTEAVRTLIQAGADVKTIPILGFTVQVHSTGYGALLPQSLNGPIDNKTKQQIIRLLLNGGANPDLRYEGQTALDMAMEWGDQQTVHTLRNYKPKRRFGSGTTRCFMGFL